MRALPITHRVLTCIAFATLWVGVAGAWPSPDPPRGYTLGAGSLFQEGCFDPCMCPILESMPVEGSFSLRELTSEGDVRHFEVLDVSWLVPLYGGNEHRVRGEGHYWFDPVARAEQMTLDLVLDDRDPAHFDSGVLEKELAWPAIDLVVSVNGFFCFDTVFDLHAAPTSPVPTAQPSRWGVVKAAYRE